jgi:glycosyltransferase involved in cell wall biosynthesis
VVQARVAGRPVVATRVCGTPEVVLDGETGILLEPHDVPGFADAFVRLARDPDLRARLGARGASGLEDFDQELMVDQQERLYEQLLSGERASPTAGRLAER